MRTRFFSGGNKTCMIFFHLSRSLYKRLQNQKDHEVRELSEEGFTFLAKRWYTHFPVMLTVNFYPQVWLLEKPNSNVCWGRTKEWTTRQRNGQQEQTTQYEIWIMMFNKICTICTICTICINTFCIYVFVCGNDLECPIKRVTWIPRTW